MNSTRRAALLSKANNFVAKLRASQYTDDGKAVYTLLYQVDTMIYGLASINTDDWRNFLKEFKEAKYVLRTHSKDQQVKKANFIKANSSVLQTLEKYIEYLLMQSKEPA
jgi:hypothetical protein